MYVSTVPIVAPSSFSLMVWELIVILVVVSLTVTRMDCDAVPPLPSSTVTSTE